VSRIPLVNFRVVWELQAMQQSFRLDCSTVIDCSTLIAFEVLYKNTLLYVINQRNSEL